MPFHCLDQSNGHCQCHFIAIASAITLSHCHFHYIANAIIAIANAIAIVDVVAIVDDISIAIAIAIVEYK